MSNKSAQKHKAHQNYEQNAPKCRACKFFRHAQLASPPIVKDGVEIAPALKYIPPTCVFPPTSERGGNPFAVSPEGVCDEWVHRVTKETLA